MSPLATSGLVLNRISGLDFREHSVNKIRQQKTLLNWCIMASLKFRRVISCEYRMKTKKAVGIGRNSYFGCLLRCLHWPYLWPSGVVGWLAERPRESG